MQMINNKDIPEFILHNFGKVKGLLTCQDSNYCINMKEDYLTFSYYCCDALDCVGEEYTKYTSPIDLLKNHKDTLSYIDSSWFFILDRGT
jgi:hypothetical protein